MDLLTNEFTDVRDEFIDFASWVKNSILMRSDNPEELSTDEDDDDEDEDDDDSNSP
jgi:hypothetical protein